MRVSTVVTPRRQAVITALPEGRPCGLHVPRKTKTVVFVDAVREAGVRERCPRRSSTTHRARHGANVPYQGLPSAGAPV